MLDSSQESEPAQDNPHFIMSIEKQLQAIQTKQSNKTTKPDPDNIEGDSDG